MRKNSQITTRSYNNLLERIGEVLFETVLQPSNSVNDLILGLELKEKNGG